MMETSLGIEAIELFTDGVVQEFGQVLDEHPFGRLLEGFFTADAPAKLVLERTEGYLHIACLVLALGANRGDINRSTPNTQIPTSFEARLVGIEMEEERLKHFMSW